MAEETDEITLELLSDISLALSSVARDLLPLVRFTCAVLSDPTPCVRFVIPGQTDKPIQALLQELAETTRDVTDKAIPSLKLRYMVIGGSEASGIEVTIQPGSTPVYGHVIKAKVDRLLASDALRGKPQLVDQVLKGITP